MVFDIPLYPLSKYVQWQWPNSFGEGKFPSMAGGLHIEKALWTILGDILDGSGWCFLVESGLTTAGKTSMMLSCSYIKRTRYAYQVTVIALARLKMEAFEKYKMMVGTSITINGMWKCDKSIQHSFFGTKFLI